MFWNLWVTFLAFIAIFGTLTLIIGVVEYKPRLKDSIVILWRTLKLVLAFIGLDRVLFWLAGG